MEKIIEIKKGESKKYIYENIIHDSKEEIYFKWYCDDLLKSGHIKEVRYQPAQWFVIPSPEYSWFKKNTKSETEKRGNLLQPLKYTPDFIIFWSQKGVEEFVYIPGYENVSVLSPNRKPFIAIKKDGYPEDKLISYIDTKGTYGRYGDSVKFSMVQKIIYFALGIYIEKIIPKKLFEKTFYPERYLWTDGATKKRKL